MKAFEQVHESELKEGVKCEEIMLHAISKHRALVMIIDRTGKRREVGE